MAENKICSPQIRRNEASELIELATTPDADLGKYGPVPLESPIFSCLSNEDKHFIIDSIVTDKLIGKSLSIQIEDANKIVNNIPNMASSPDIHQGHPLKKGQKEI